MAKHVYGFVNPASGYLTAPQRTKKGSIEVVIHRTNFEEYEKIRCPVCGKLKDILVVSVEKVKTFFNCPCGHNWTKDCDCITEVNGSDILDIADAGIGKLHSDIE